MLEKLILAADFLKYWLKSSLLSLYHIFDLHIFDKENILILIFLPCSAPLNTPMSKTIISEIFSLSVFQTNIHTYNILSNV